MILTQNVPYEPVWGDDGRRFFIDRFGFGVFRRRSCTSIHGCCGRTNHRTQASGSVISRRNSRNSARGTFRDLDSRPRVVAVDPFRSQTPHGACLRLSGTMAGALGIKGADASAIGDG